MKKITYEHGGMLLNRFSYKYIDDIICLYNGANKIAEMIDNLDGFDLYANNFDLLK